MVSFEIFVRAMLPSLSELKVLPSFCFAFKIPDYRAVTNTYVVSRPTISKNLERYLPAGLGLQRPLPILASGIFHAP